MDNPFDMVAVLARSKALGLTPSRIAQKAGVAQSTMSRWMHEECIPSWPKWKRLLEALDRLEQQAARPLAPVTSFRGGERARDWPANHPAGVPSPAQPGRAVRAAGHQGG